MKRSARVGLALIVTCFGLLISASPASAHASLESTNPTADLLIAAAPPTVVMTFSEGVTATKGGVKIVGPTGVTVSEGSPRRTADGRSLSVDLASEVRGTYTVSWRVTSDDGHTISGSWVFHVQEQTEAAAVVVSPSESAESPLSLVGRVAFYAGFIAAFGLLCFATWMPSAHPRHYRSVNWSALLALAGSVLALIGRGVETTGNDVLTVVGNLGDVVSGTRAGALDAIRVGLCLVLVGSLRARRRLLGMIVGCALAAVVAISGHAWVASPVGLVIVADAVHLVAVAVWVGGLFGLAMFSKTEPPLIGRARRFSRLATFALATVVATGLISTWAQVGRWSAFIETDYGRFLTAKLLLVGVMICLGWLNRRQLATAVARAARFITTVRSETSIGMLVIVVTSFLVATVPSRAAEATPPVQNTQFLTTVTIGSGSVQLGVDPGRLGSNLMHLTFFDANGGSQPVDAAEARISSSSIESRRVPLTPFAPNHYIAEGVSFGEPGVWTIEVTAVTKGQSASTEVEVQIR